MMNKYYLKKSLKTKLLNIVRRFFTLQFWDSIIANKIKRNQSKLWVKIAPPNYLYSKGNIRIVNRDGNFYKFEISNYVDHFLYFDFSDTEYDSIIDSVKMANIIFDIGANIGYIY